MTARELAGKIKAEAYSYFGAYSAGSSDFDLDEATALIEAHDRELLAAAADQVCRACSGDSTGKMCDPSEMVKCLFRAAILGGKE